MADNTAGLISLEDPIVGATYARYTQLKGSGMPDDQIFQTLEQEQTKIPISQLALKLLALKQAAQRQQPPPQSTIDQQLTQQLQATQNPQPQGVAAIPQNAVAPGQMPQGMPPQGMPPQGMPPQMMPPQGMPQGGPMPPPGMAAGGLASLPVDNIGKKDAYATGGIVAFNDGGDVKHAYDGMLAKSSNSPFANQGPFIGSLPTPTMMTRGIPSNSDEVELEKLQKLYSIPNDVLARTDPDMYQMLYGPGSEQVKQRYKQLQSKFSELAEKSRITPEETLDAINQKQLAATQQQTINKSRQLGSSLGLNIPEDTSASTASTTSAAPPAASDTLDISKYMQNAYNPYAPLPSQNVAPRTGAGAGAGAGSVDAPKYDTDFDIKAFMAEGAPDEDTLVKENLAKRAAYEKEHGIGAYEDELISYLQDQGKELQAESKYNRSMALAQWGFQLASTPGSFIHALAKTGVGFAQTMMELNAKDKALQRQMKLSMLQAKAAKEKGEMAKYDAAVSEAHTTKKEWTANRFDMAQLVQNNKTLANNAKHMAYSDVTSRMNAETAARSTANSAALMNATTRESAQRDRLMKAQVEMTADLKLRGATPEQIQQKVDELWSAYRTGQSSTASSLNTAARLTASQNAAISKSVLGDYGVQQATAAVAAARKAGNPKALAAAQEALANAVASAKQTALLSTSLTDQSFDYGGDEDLFGSGAE